MGISEGTILRVVLTLLFSDSSVMQNVFNAVLTAAGGSDDEQDVADDMADWMDDIFTNLIPKMWDGITASDVTVYEYDSVDDDWDEVGSGTPTFVPAAADNLLPRGAAAVVNANSIDPDVQGRKYFGGFTEIQYSELGWGGAVITVLVAAAADWITTFVGAATGADFQPVVWSPTGKVAKAFSGVVTVPIFAGYQRRRKEGVGI